MEPAHCPGHNDKGSTATTTSSSSTTTSLGNFPIFVGHRRRLLPTDDLFSSNLGPHTHDDHLHGHHEVTQHASTHASIHHRQTQHHLFLRDSLHFSPKFECNTCHIVFPTAHVLDLHLTEIHDSYFAAQAARRLPVYACLVEACSRKFCTIMERRQHLIDYHKFPRGQSLDRMHVAVKKAQIRPLSVKTDRKEQKEEEEEEGGGESTSMNSRMDVEQEDALIGGMSRLRMSAVLSTVPRSVVFGRRRGGRFMTNA